MSERRGVHEAQGAERDDAPAGWYPCGDPDDGVRWWDGTRWTSKIRRTAPVGAVRRMVAMAVVGTVLVVWGAAIAVTLPGWTESQCEALDGPAGDDPGMAPWSLWLMWIVLAVMAAIAVIRWKDAGRGDRRMTRLMILGVVAAVGLCPFWYSLGIAADCGL